MTDTSNGERVPCELGCGAMITPSRMKFHITQSHKNEGNPDEIFQKVAAATKVLWPDPEDVYLHFEMIADWRKFTMKMLTRG